MTAYQLVEAHLRGSAEVKVAAIRSCGREVVLAAALVTEALKSGGKLLLCGNGGSAADAQHLAAEFTSRLRLDFERPGLAALALTTDTSFLTAFANDFSFSGVFARAIEALGRAGDVVLGITTSGRSQNVLAAFEQARKQQMRCIAFTGQAGIPAGVNVDVTVSVPSVKTQHVQETHIALGHLLCQIVEESLFPESLLP